MRERHWISIIATSILIVTILLVFLPSQVSITSEGTISIGLSHTYASPGTTKQVIFGGCSDLPLNDFGCLFGMGDATWLVSPESKLYEIIPTAGKLTNFKVSMNTAPGVGKTKTFTIRKNGANTDLSVSVADTATISSLDTDEVTVAAGDRIDIYCSATSGSADSLATYWTCEFIPDTSGETIVIGNSEGETSTSGRYLPLCGVRNDQTTEFYVQTLFPCAGTLKNFYIWQSVAPGTDKSWTYTIRKNASAQSLAVTISGSATTGSDTDVGHAVSIAAGDVVAIVVTATNTPATCYAAWGAVFVPSTEGQFISNVSTSISMDAGATEYIHLSGGFSEPLATEYEKQCLARGCTAKAIYVKLNYSPGTGNSYDFTLRKNSSTDTALTVQIEGAATTGNFATDVAISDDDLLTTKIVPTSTPTTRTPLIAYLFYIAPEGGGTGAEVAPTTLNVGVQDVNTSYSTAINHFRATNIGTGAIDITIKGTDATGGGDTWDLSDTGAPGENIFALYAGLDDADDTFDIIIKEDSPYNALVEDLAEDATQDFGLKVYMPVTVTGYEGQAMTSTVTLIVSAS